MTKASDSAAFDKLRPRARRGEPFGPEFLDTARNPEFIEGLKAEGLVAGRQSLRKDFITILLDNWFDLLLIGTHLPEEP
jgi:hypothetical protein